MVAAKPKLWRLEKVIASDGGDAAQLSIAVDAQRLACFQTASPRRVPRQIHIHRALVNNDRRMAVAIDRHTEFRAAIDDVRVRSFNAEANGIGTDPHAN